MPAIDAIIYNGFHTRQLSNPGINTVNYFPPGYLLASGLTAGDTYIVKHIADGPPVFATTAGQFTAVSSKGLAPFRSGGFANRSYILDWPVTSSAVSVALLAILTDASVTVATAFMRPSYPYSHGNLADWSISQASDKSVVIALQSLNTVDSHTVLYSLTDGGAHTSPAGENKPSSRSIYTVDLLDRNGTQLATQSLHWPKDGSNPVVTFSSSSVVSTGNHVVKISNVVANPADTITTLISQEIQTVLTAPTVTTGGNANMFSWLNNDYWYLTDLQVNLGTRAVTHRHGTIELRPNDTVNFGVFFHDGAASKDPVATDLRLAVRSSTNTSAYYFWANPSVTTTSVSGDIFYTITVTASDEDLLAAQAAGLVAGSNTSQTLLAEVQWTTTRGTFTSDTFNITMANEVAREPDV